MVSEKQEKSCKKPQFPCLGNSSHEHSGTSVISDSSNYMQELAEKAVEKTSQINSILPLVITVEEKESSEGFGVKVFSEKSCPGLLVFILEALEDLALDVRQARVSCSHNFCLEALGIIIDNGQQKSGHKDAQAVEQGIIQAILSWSESAQRE